MASKTKSRLGGLVGRSVGLALNDGTRFDDCHLLSIAGARAVTTAWIVLSGVDVFVPVETIDDVWEL